MARKSFKALEEAIQYSKLLLYSFSGGNMGTKPELPLPTNLTAGESRGFLDSLIKIADLKMKAAEGQEQESGFEKIQRNLNAGRENGNRGNSRRPAENLADEWSVPLGADATDEAPKDSGTEGSGV